jgi:hypothetical protein
LLLRFAFLSGFYRFARLTKGIDSNLMYGRRPIIITLPLPMDDSELDIESGVSPSNPGMDSTGAPAISHQTSGVPHYLRNDSPWSQQSQSSEGVVEYDVELGLGSDDSVASPAAASGERSSIVKSFARANQPL